MPELTLHCWTRAVAIKAHCVQQDYVMLSQRTCERMAEYHHMNPIPVKWKRLELGILAEKLQIGLSLGPWIKRMDMWYKQAKGEALFRQDRKSQ